ncbi:MAG: YvcK family protein [Caldilineaceae bacterium]|nr:YvcK family protein [Caldilineaceae bacterium]
MSSPSIHAHWSHFLRPGLHIKRWILLLLVGITVAALGMAFLIREWYITDQLPPAVYSLALRSLPNWLRGMLLLGVGLLATIVGVWQLNRSIIIALLPGQSAPGNIEMVNVILDRQRRRQGPRVVAIGGGTGMPQLLRGLRTYTDNITAIVTVADDGGSSGRLRRQMGMLPPGDFRNNIAALSEAEDLMTRLFQYRFAESDIHAERDDSDEDDHQNSEENTLAGHSFGNLFITTMAAVTGSFESGIAESSRVLAVRGQVLPSTLEHVTLCAEICRPAAVAAGDGDEADHAAVEDDTPEEEWVVVEGESKIPKAGGRIMRVFLKPEHARAYPLTIQAILQADLIVAAPGSFFTSVMPNLLVPDICAAISASLAQRIYVCNITTQPGETDGFTVSEHMRQLRAHVGNAITTVLANDNFDYPLETSSPFVGDWVRLPSPNEALNYRLFTGDLADSKRPWRHDPQKLAARLMAVYAELQAEK